MYYGIEQINVSMLLGAMAFAVEEETHKSGMGEGKKESSGNPSEMEALVWIYDF